MHADSAVVRRQTRTPCSIIPKHTVAGRPRRPLTGGVRVVALALMLALFNAIALGTGGALAAGSIRVTITGENHAPVANRPWTYSLTVTSATRSKVSGTVTTEFLFGGAVVGHQPPENVRFKNGVYHDTLTFPAEAKGFPLVGVHLVLEAVVRTADGTGEASWSIVTRS